MTLRNFDQEITDFNGTVIIDAETKKPLLMRTMLVNACGATFTDPNSGARQFQESGADLLHRYELGMALNKGGEIDISPEDAILLKKLLMLVPAWGPILVAPVLKYIDS